jgi:hypothetical protein
MTVKELCAKMDRSKNIVQKYVSGLSFEKPEEPAVAEPEPVKSVPSDGAGNMFARNKERGATIMTEAASARGDEAKVNPRPPKRYRNIIHTIKED